MSISYKQTMGLLAFSALLFSGTELVADPAAPAANDQWSRVEAAAGQEKKEAERRVEAEAAAIREREAAEWNRLKTENARTSAETEAKIAEQKKQIEAKAADGAVRDKANADLAQERAKADAAERARSEAEAALAAEKAKADEEIKKLKAENEARLAAEKAKANEEIEKAKAEAEAKLAAEKAKAAEEIERAKAENEAKLAAEKAKAAEEIEKTKAENGAKLAAEKAKADEEITRAKEQNGVTTSEKITSDGEGESWFAKVGNAFLWYIPHRLSDLMDIFTFEIGAGELGIDLQLTRYLTFGAGIGQSYMLGWSIYNQHGIYFQRGWYADVLRYRVSDTRREGISGFYTPIFRGENNLVDIGEMRDAKAEDPWALGVKACCYLNLKLQIHPEEIGDFIAGFLFIDFKDDDNYKFNWVFGGF